MPGLVLFALNDTDVSFMISTSKTSWLTVMTTVRYTFTFTLSLHLLTKSSHCPNIPVRLGFTSDGKKLSDSFPPLRLAGVGSPKGSWVMRNLEGSCAVRYFSFSSCRWTRKHRSEHIGISVFCSENGRTRPHTLHVVTCFLKKGLTSTIFLCLLESNKLKTRNNVVSVFYRTHMK